MKIQALNLDQIEATAATQARARTDPDTVQDYAERMQAGDTFPPLVVFAEENAETGFHLADGFHRLKAAQSIGVAMLPVELHTGTLRNAIEYALKANDNHGLRRSHKDKRSAVLFALKDAWWCELSNRQLAEKCNVSHTFVANVKAELDEKASRKTEPKATKTEKPDENMRPTMPAASQQDDTLRRLREAFEILATCEIGGDIAVEEYGDSLGDHFSAALEWMAEADEAMNGELDFN